MTEGVKKRSQGHLCLHRFVTVEHQEASQRCGNYICTSQVLYFVLKSRVNDFFFYFFFFFFFFAWHRWRFCIWLQGRRDLGRLDALRPHFARHGYEKIREKGGSGLVVSLVNLLKITGFHWMKRWRAGLQDQSTAAITSFTFFFFSPFPVVLDEHQQRRSAIRAPSCSFLGRALWKAESLSLKKGLNLEENRQGPRWLRVFCSDSSTAAMRVWEFARPSLRRTLRFFFIHEL